MTTRHTDAMRPLAADETAAVAGATQLYSHQFTYINYQLNGLRPFEPSFEEAVNDANMPVTR